MKTYTVIAKLLPNYNDFGSATPTKRCLQLFDELIAKLLPNECQWCGNEIIAPINFDAESFDLDEIMRNAFEKLISKNENGLWI